jgi:hypothetical protein
MTTEEWYALPRPAQNCCANCAHELTCGYSELATIGERDEKWSFGHCVLGKMSSGRDFFERKAA